MIALLMTLALLCLTESPLQRIQDEVAADEFLTDADLAAWVAQLGDDDFKKRVEAEELLTQAARSDSEKMLGYLRARLAAAESVEARYRLQRVIRKISSAFPIRVIVFSESELENDSWILVDNVAKESSFSFKEDVLQIDSLDKFKEGMTFRHHFDAAIDANRMVLDAEIKIGQEKHANAQGAGVHLNIENDAASHPLMIQEDRIFLYRTNWQLKMDTTDQWHHFRFVIDGATQQVFVDDMDKPVVERPRPNVAGRHWAAFGDGTGAAGARAQFRNVKFSRFISSKK